MRKEKKKKNYDLKWNQNIVIYMLPLLLMNFNYKEKWSSYPIFLAPFILSFSLNYIYVIHQMTNRYGLNNNKYMLSDNDSIYFI